MNFWVNSCQCKVRKAEWRDVFKSIQVIADYKPSKCFKNSARDFYSCLSYGFDIQVVNLQTTEAMQLSKSVSLYIEGKKRLFFFLCYSVNASQRNRFTAQVNIGKIQCLEVLLLIILERVNWKTNPSQLLTSEIPSERSTAETLEGSDCSEGQKGLEQV